jgi:hypothetical protein
VSREPVLVLRALGLGDALTAVPALRGLRRLYGDRPLLLAGPRPVSGWLCRRGLADGVVETSGLSGPAPGASLGPHVAVNLHGRGPQSHRLLLRAAPRTLIGFAYPGLTDGPAWRADEHEVLRWCRLAPGAGARCDPADLRLGHGDRSGPVLVHPGAASAARRWPPRCWAAVATALSSDGHPVAVTGSAAEYGLCEDVTCGAVPNLAGKFGLDGLAATVADARLLLSSDTGVAHLATAFGTPSVTLFGPTPPSLWGPAIDQDIHRVLYAGSGPGDPHAERIDPALLAIRTGDVVAAARELLTPAGQVAAGTSSPSS